MSQGANAGSRLWVRHRLGHCCMQLPSLVNFFSALLRMNYFEAICPSGVNLELAGLCGASTTGMCRVILL